MEKYREKKVGGKYLTNKHVALLQAQLVPSAGFVR